MYLRAILLGSGTKLKDPPAPRYGWMKDDHDDRDYRYSPPSEVIQNLPPEVDLRTGFPPAYNQGNMNSCTANAIAAAIEYDERREKVRKAFIPSRLFIYYNERAMEGTADSDSGAQIRDGIKSVSKLGCCKEILWPYKERLLKLRPRARCYKQAVRYKAVQYERVSYNLEHMKSCLASGFPFVFGIKVYSSFEDARVREAGHLEIPKQSEKLVGKHAVIAAGYQDSRKWFIVRNSWGKKWGIEGYFTLPYEYLMDRKLSGDIWTIKVIR